MIVNLFRGSLVCGCLLVACHPAKGQEVVHALTGTVTAIDAKNHTIKVKTYDDSEGLFKVQMTSNAAMDFSSKVKVETMPARDFSKTGAPVLVYFIGDAMARTAVAVQDLGAGPIDKSKGTVVKLNKHQHTLMIRNDSGAMETFMIDDKTVAETAQGVAPGDKYDAEKGDGVWVTSRSDGGKKTALFLRAR